MNGWTSVINAVKTPLGFFVLIALISDGILSVAIATGKISVWAPIGVLVLLIACVFVISWKKPWALVPRKVITVNLDFPIEPIQVELNVNQCLFKVRDMRGKTKRTGTPNLIFGNGGWSFQLTEDIESSDSVHLELVENKRRWRVNPFLPYETTVKAIEQVR